MVIERKLSSGYTLRIDTVGVQGKIADQVRLGLPTGGAFQPGLIDLDANANVVDTIDALNAAATGGGGGPTEDRVGWIRIVDVTIAVGETVTNKAYQDPPGNTILQSCTVSNQSFDLIVESSYPVVTYDNVDYVLPLVGSIYRGSVSITLSASGDVTVETKDANAGPGAQDTIAVVIETPAQITDARFTGGYPGSQTELKEDDNFDIVVTADKPFDRVVIIAQDACKSASIDVAAGLSATVTSTIANQGVTAQPYPAALQIRDASTGALSTVRLTNEFVTGDGAGTVVLNNLFPSVSIGAKTYPGGQQALKASESATVVNTASDYDVIAYDSPTSELSITNPSTFENPKTVTRSSGNYNISTNNFRITATRNANAAVTISQGVVNIAAVAAAVNVSEPASRLRSGGNNGTSIQSHTITITADQQLLSAPSLSPDSGGSRGTFAGAGFTGGPTVWTRSLEVHDDDDKGTFNWESLSATNLAGIVTTTITGDAQYTLGGFVARSLTFAAFSDTTQIGTSVEDFSKLTAGIFTATNSPALKQAIGTPPSVTNGYTINATGANPTNLIWLDTPAVNSNSGGTAQITNVQETV